MRKVGSTADEESVMYKGGDNSMISNDSIMTQIIRKDSGSDLQESSIIMRGDGQMAETHQKLLDARKYMINESTTKNMRPEQKEELVLSYDQRCCSCVNAGTGFKILGILNVVEIVLVLVRAIVHKDLYEDSKMYNIVNFIRLVPTFSSLYFFARFIRKDDIDTRYGLRYAFLSQIVFQILNFVLFINYPEAFLPYDTVTTSTIGLNGLFSFLNFMFWVLLNYYWIQVSGKFSEYQQPDANPEPRLRKMTSKELK